MQDFLDKQLEANLRGDFETGWRIANILKKTTPHCNRAKFNRGWMELHRGNLQEGFRLLDVGRFENVFGSPHIGTAQPLWQGESLDGKTLLFAGEGGFGDEIINIRFVKDIAARGGKSVVIASPTLASIFARIPEVSAVIDREAAPKVYHDCWLPAMSAVWVCGHTYESLNGQPYLSAHADYVAKWRRRLPNDGRKRVGLRWRGNPKYEHEQYRCFPTERMFKALDPFPDLFLCSLQTMGLEYEAPTHIKRFGEKLLHWEETAGLLANLDLVITSCTATAHMGAAMGIETWVVVPILPYYIWALPGERSPWYDSVKLYRQSKFASWVEPFDKIREDLKLWKQKEDKIQHLQCIPSSF